MYVNQLKKYLITKIDFDNNVYSVYNITKLFNKCINNFTFFFFLFDKCCHFNWIILSHTFFLCEYINTEGGGGVNEQIKSIVLIIVEFKYK